MKRPYIILSALYVIAFIGAMLFAGQAAAHPHDAPQIGDIAQFGYKGADCHNGFTSVVGRNDGARNASFALQRKVNGKWELANEGNDGARAYIGGILYEGRSDVDVPPGQLFEIEHHQSRGDTGEYRWITWWTYGPVNPVTGRPQEATLAQWVSRRPGEQCPRGVTA